MMALVDYDSADEGENEDSTGLSHMPKASSAGCKDLKRKRLANNPDLPPLPSKFHDLYASKVRLSTLDDPSLHGGRKRITPHVEGNWPSHVYIEWYPSTTELELLASLITPIQNAAGRADEIEMVSLLTSDLGTPLPLHVSLSRPIVFTAAQKDCFVESLQQNIIGCGVRPFELKLRNLYWASNFEETRWFLAIQLQRPEGDELNKLLAVCNGTVEDYLQPPLYATPRSTCQQSPKANGRPRKYGRTNMSASSSNEEILDFSTLFHISIGWALERPSSSVMDHTNSLINNEGFESLRNVPVKVDTLKMKIGNIITSISLAPKAAEGKSIFGA